MRLYQTFKDWNRKRKLKILYDIVYVPEIRTYRIVRIRAGKAPPDYLRVTGSKTEFVRYEGMHDIPEDDSMLTAMGLQSNRVLILKETYNTTKVLCNRGLTLKSNNT